MFMFHLTHWHSSIFKSIKSGLIRKNKANKWVTKINTSIGWKKKIRIYFTEKMSKRSKSLHLKKKEKYSPDILRLVQVFESVTLIENRRTMLWFFIFPVFFLVCLFFSLTVVVFFSTNFKIPFVVNSCTSFLQSNERNSSMKTSFHMLSLTIWPPRVTNI